MYRKIVVPLDGAKKSELSLPVAQQLAESTGCELHLVVAISMNQVLFVDIDDRLPRDFEKLGEQQVHVAGVYLEKIAAPWREAGMTVFTQVIQQSAAEGVCGYAREHGADLIVMTCTGKSNWARWIGGSTSDGILRQAPCSVMAVRPPHTPG
jgi:nucleotide-binding universal stress UspA family protein